MVKSHVQIVGTATHDSTPSVLVFFDNKRYLFNVGEGTQRMCLEHKIKLGRVDNIFLSSLNWEVVGGLPGMILTVADVGTEHLKLGGPRGLLDMLLSTRFFLQRTNLCLEIQEYAGFPRCVNSGELQVIPVILDPSGTLRENPLSFSTGSTSTTTASQTPQTQPIPLPPYKTSKYYPSQKLKNKDEEDTYYLSYYASSPRTTTSVSLDKDENGDLDVDAEGKDDATIAKPRKKARLEFHEPAVMKRGQVYPTGAALLALKQQSQQPQQPQQQLQQPLQQLQIQQKQEPVVSYICHGQDIPGKFDPKKAIELGIPKGPLYGKLVAGETVKSPTTGLDVLPSQCMAQTIPGPIFIIITCPAPDYVSHVTQNPVFKDYYASSNRHHVSFVIHMTEQIALEQNEYKEWMQRFGEQTQHIIINSDTCAHNFVFRATTENQYILNTLNKDLFPLPFCRPPRRQLEAYPFANVYTGENLMQLHLAPISKQGIIDRSATFTDVEDGSFKTNAAATWAAPALQEMLQDHKKWESENKITPIAGEPSLLFLGTGSALPSKYRNVTGMHFSPKGGAGLMLDAGEGSYGQLYRRFGTDIHQVLRELQMVWISHIHADHHLGLIRILNQRAKVEPSGSVVVVGPRLLGKWLADYAACCQANLLPSIKYTFVDCEELTSPHNRLRAFMESTYGITEFQNMEVLHCPEAYAAIASHADGWKLVYSGDTRVCAELERVGKNATVLIHEATLEDGMEEDAHSKGHSTTGEAVASGLRMTAEWILLTHFSQRYPKIPVLQNYNKVGIAFDLMHVRWSTLGVLPRLLPVLAQIFKEEEGEDGDSTDTNTNNNTNTNTNNNNNNNTNNTNTNTDPTTTKTPDPNNNKKANNKNKNNNDKDKAMTNSKNNNKDKSTNNPNNTNKPNNTKTNKNQNQTTPNTTNAINTTETV